MRIAALLLAAFVLAGCSDADWDHLMTFGGGRTQQDADAPQAAPQVQAPQVHQAETGQAPVAQAAQAPAAPDTSFCQAVAAQDATGNDFDQATQARVAAQSFRQCVAVFGAR